MSNNLDHEVSIRELQGAVTVDFTTPIQQTAAKLRIVKEDAEHNKTAKPYLETIKAEFRNQLQFLYIAANSAFPDDPRTNPNRALKQYSPEDILRLYDFKVTVMKKQED